MNEPNAVPAESVAATKSDPAGKAPVVLRGDRGIPSVNKVRSVQAHLTRVLSGGLIAVLAGGLLFWYVKQASGAAGRVTGAAQAATRAKAAGDMVVPPLGPVMPPRLAVAAPPSDAVDEDVIDDLDENDPSALEAVIGERPPPPHWSDYAPAEAAPSVNAFTPSTTMPSVEIVDRRLQGSVFAAVSGPSSGGLSSATPNSGGLLAGSEPPSRGESLDNDSSSPSDSLTPGATVVRATRLPTRRWWLPKGSFLDGTLETAIDTTLPGLVTAVLSSDTYGADGQVVLLERGTRLLGEIRNTIARGQSRVFIEWREARTPTGVIVELQSPTTDALGRSGLDGEVDRHFGERFGAAILVSVLDGLVQAGVAAAREGNGSDIVVSPSGSRDIAGEVLKDTLGIPTTIRVAPGTRLQVLVARDVDFRGVYGLGIRAAR